MVNKAKKFVQGPPPPFWVKPERNFFQEVFPLSGHVTFYLVVFSPDIFISHRDSLWEISISSSFFARYLYLIAILWEISISHHYSLRDIYSSWDMNIWSGFFLWYYRGSSWERGTCSWKLLSDWGYSSEDQGHHLRILLWRDKYSGSGCSAPCCSPTYKVTSPKNGDDKGTIKNFKGAGGNVPEWRKKVLTRRATKLFIGMW